MNKPILTSSKYHDYGCAVCVCATANWKSFLFHSAPKTLISLIILPGTAIPRGWEKSPQPPTPPPSARVVVSSVQKCAWVLEQLVHKAPEPLGISANRKRGDGGGGNIWRLVTCCLVLPLFKRRKSTMDEGFSVNSLIHAHPPHTGTPFTGLSHFRQVAAAAEQEYWNLNGWN